MPARPKPPSSPTERLDYRRAQIARASRALRERRREEVLNLRAENDRLKAERASFLDQIHTLSLQLPADSASAASSTTADDIALLENQLLKSQVEQSNLYLISLLSASETKLPDPDRINKEIADDTLDMAWLRVSRAMDIGAHHWTEPVVINISDHPNMLLVARLHIQPEGTVIIRCEGLRVLDASMAISAEHMRNVIMEAWADQSMFNKAYIPKQTNSIFSFEPCPSFCWEPSSEFDESRTRIITSHVVEQTPEINYDWIFLLSSKQEKLARSVMWGGPKIDALVAEFKGDVADDTSEPKHKRARGQEDGQEPPRGVAQVFSCLRTVTCHGSALADDVVRMVDNFTEAYFCWNVVEPDQPKIMYEQILCLLCVPPQCRVPPFAEAVEHFIKKSEEKAAAVAGGGAQAELSANFVQVAEQFAKVMVQTAFEKKGS